MKSLGVSALFKVQKETIRTFFEYSNCDIGISAPTGSGKTLSYLLPILSSLLSKNITRMRAVVLVPSKELCKQVLHVVQKLTTNTNIKPGTIEAANGDVDIIVTTAGALFTAIFEKSVCLKFLNFIVFDEVDKIVTNSSASVLYY